MVVAHVGQTKVVVTLHNFHDLNPSKGSHWKLSEDAHQNLSASVSGMQKPGDMPSRHASHGFGCSVNPHRERPRRQEEAARQIELTPFEAAKEAAPIGMKITPTTKNVLIT